MKADIFSDPQDTKMISQLRTGIEIKNDFIQWLFEDSGELDYTDINEQWEKFEKWQDEQDIN